MTFWRVHDCSFDVKIMGGLGNQLFQFSHGVNIALVTNRSIIFRTDSYSTDDLRKSWLFELDIEPNLPYKVSIFGGRVVFQMVEDKCQCAPLVLNESNFHFSELELPKERFILQGYWQSEFYFLEYASLIRQYVKSKLISPTLSSKPNLVIHIRLGDMLSVPAVLSKHGVLGIEYYLQALTILNPTKEVHIISDSPELLGDNYLHALQFKYPNLEFKLDIQQIALKDFSLLTFSRQIVVANSTFSWWGAYLSEAETIIAPRKVFSQKTLRDLNTCDFYPQNWILI